MAHLFQEKTLPRTDLKSRARGSIRKNTTNGIMKIRAELELCPTFCFKTEPSLGFELNGDTKNANKTTETIEDEENGAFGKPVAKARLRMKATMTVTPFSVFPRGKCVDVNSGNYDHEC